MVEKGIRLVVKAMGIRFHVEKLAQHVVHNLQTLLIQEGHIAMEEDVRYVVRDTKHMEKTQQIRNIPEHQQLTLHYILVNMRIV